MIRPPKQPLTAIDNWSDLQRSGGIRSLERRLASEARHAVLKSERERWLLTLKTWEQNWHSRIGDNKPDRRDLKEIAFITSEPTRLRRLLGIAPPSEELRRQNRERVRRFRERQRRSIATGSRLSAS